MTLINQTELHYVNKAERGRLSYQFYLYSFPTNNKNNASPFGHVLSSMPLLKPNLIPNSPPFPLFLAHWDLNFTSQHAVVHIPPTSRTMTPTKDKWKAKLWMKAVFLTRHFEGSYLKCISIGSGPGRKGNYVFPLKASCMQPQGKLLC